MCSSVGTNYIFMQAGLHKKKSVGTTPKAERQTLSARNGVEVMWQTKIRNTFIANVVILLLAFGVIAIRGACTDEAQAVQIPNFSPGSMAQIAPVLAPTSGSTGDPGMVGAVLQYGALGLCGLMVVFSFTRESRMAKRITEMEKFIETVVRNNTEAMTNLRDMLGDRPCLINDSRVKNLGKVYHQD